MIDQQPFPSKRIVFTTIGSLGDLYPSVVIASELQRRGHETLIAASAVFQPYVESFGLPFTPLRPDMAEEALVKNNMARMMDSRAGTTVVLKEAVLPYLRATYDDTMAAARGADLLVSNALTLATPMAADRLGIPWASLVLQPSIFFSAYDPPELSQFPVLSRAWNARPWMVRGARKLADLQMRGILRPASQFRHQLGLPRSRRNPLLDDQHSPLLTIAMFSPLFAAPQPDWPPQTVVAGFPFFAPDQTTPLPARLNAFLDAGAPPLVFTLGSSAVFSPGSFYRDAAAAAAALGRRAVLLTGPDAANCPAHLPPSVIAVDYASHALLFPRAAAIVHQGGIGTTAEAMRAGKPMLVIPFAHDQPDNARRVRRLGIARTLPRARLNPESLEVALRLLLGDSGYAIRSTNIAARLAEEDGVGVASDALERLLACPTAARRPTASMAVFAGVR